MNENKPKLKDALRDSLARDAFMRGLLSQIAQKPIAEEVTPIMYDGWESTYYIDVKNAESAVDKLLHTLDGTHIVFVSDRGYHMADGDIFKSGGYLLDVWQKRTGVLEVYISKHKNLRDLKKWMQEEYLFDFNIHDVED